MFRVQLERTAALFAVGFTALAARGSAPRQFVTQLPPGARATTSSFTNATSTPLPDQANVTSTLVVAAAGAYLWDVDLPTSISHSWCGESSGGPANACDGALSLDWNAFRGAHPAALGAPWVIAEKPSFKPGFAIRRPRGRPTCPTRWS